MVLFRALAVVLALAFLLCMAAFTITKQPVWRQRAMLALKWGVVWGLCFFGLLILRRAAIFI
jgi:multisubunit Na+/H+ antiporter MnhB subunit